MRKDRRVIIILVVMTVVICGGIHYKLRPSYIDVKLADENLTVRFSTHDGMIVMPEGIVDSDLGMYENGYDELSELIENSELIVIGTLDTRVQDGNVFNSQINVIKTLKGSSAKKISVFEPAFITTYNKIEELYLKCGYVPIMKNERYVFFLNREMMYKNKEQYNMLSSYVGKFRIGEKARIRTVEKGESVFINKEQNFDFIYEDKTAEISEYQLMCEEYDTCEGDSILNALKRYSTFDFGKIYEDVQNWLKNEGVYESFSTANESRRMEEL